MDQIKIGKFISSLISEKCLTQRELFRIERLFDLCGHSFYKIKNIRNDLITAGFI